MKLFKNAKKNVFIGIVILAILILGSVLLMIPLRMSSLSNTSKIAKLQCQEAGEKLSFHINASADIIRNYSYIIAHLVETDLIPKENKRQFLLSDMEIKYKNEKALKNLWCTFEPDALDGMDNNFINQLESNENGVFNPWFDDGELVTNAVDDYKALYYIIPKTTGKEAVINPYWEDISGKDVLMISFSVPIMLNDKFLGVVGTDFYIDDLKQLVAAPKIIGNGKLITDKGIIVIHDNPKFIGKIVNYSVDDIINKISSENIMDGFFKSGDKDVYKVFIPVYFGEICKPWLYVVEVPAKQVHAEARLIVGLLSIILILLVLATFFYIKTIEKNKELRIFHEVKNKLFSVIAHDLRSPITSLMSMLDLANKDLMDKEMKVSLLQIITQRVKDVYKLLDNLLQWAKTQMHGVAIAPVYFDVQTEIQTVIDNLQIIADEKKITLNCQIKNHKIFADKDMFSVIVRNLISNAIKFSNQNGVVTIDSEEQKDKLVISVKDTGIGMSQEVQKNLFKISKSKSGLGTNNETGTGLGLLLCLDFIKVNGGDLWFDSKLGEGSKFSFSLPARGI